MTKRQTLSSALGVALAIATGCSSGSNTSTVVCQTTGDAGASNPCVIYRDLSSADRQSFSSSCTSGGGDVVSACPTTNLVGCCALPSGNNEVTETCYYAGDVPSLNASCSGGTWSNTP